MRKKFTHPILLGLWMVLVIGVSGVMVGLGTVALNLRFPAVAPEIWLVGGTLSLLLLVAAFRRALRSVLK